MSRVARLRACAGRSLSVTSAVTPVVSIVIPVCNEEALLRQTVVELRAEMKARGRRYELILAENGSRDRTSSISHELCHEFDDVRMVTFPRPNYGAALRAGILAARGELVICEEVDLCDAQFHERALGLLTRMHADLVIGSKLLEGSVDLRPMARRTASRFYAWLLRGLVGFTGSDTHGLKAFRRTSLLPLVHQCVVDGDVFASELVVRAYHAGLDVREIPVRIAEKRAPSDNLMKRVPYVLGNLARMTWSIRAKR